MDIKDLFITFTGNASIMTVIELFATFSLMTFAQFAIRGLFPKNKSMRLLYGLGMPVIVCSLCLIKDVLCGFLGLYLFEIDSMM